jgi:arylsulfatase A-like enzyme
MFEGYLSEGGIRTPLIMSGKGIAGGGRISDGVTHVTDISATILAAAGVASPGEFEGKSVLPVRGRPLTPVLAGAADAVRNAEDWLGWELFGNRAIRQGDWKLLRLCVPAGTGGWQLYNLNDDPGETRDLALTRPDMAKALQVKWGEYAKSNNVILPNTSPVCGEAVLP